MSSLSRPALIWVGMFIACLLLANVGCAADESLWLTNFETAKAKAKAEKKLLLVDFTGSDWCIWCIRLRDEVFRKPEFQAEAPKKFVLVELDYPRQKELPADLKEQNQKLQEQYKIRGFPSVLVLDAEGQVVARTGYREGGPEKYVAHLSEFIEAYESIQKLRTQLADVQGLDRAKLLDQLVEAYEKLDNEIDELAAWSKEIIALDADNKAGLKPKYEFRLLMAEAARMKERRQFEEAQETIEKALAIPGIAGQQKQDAYFSQGECFFHKTDYVGLAACLKKGIEAAPDSAQASRLKSLLATYGPMAEAQEAMSKLKAQLEQAQGQDRAKILDQLIEARQKLRPTSQQDLAARTKEIDAWSREILTLDAENQAGLKRKYEFRVLLGESQDLMRVLKVKEAQTALDKALALPDLSGEQIQEANLTKGQFHISQSAFREALAPLKKGLEAAPEGSRAKMIKAMIQRCEKELATQKSQPGDQTPPAPKATEK